jgi:hypothetical protein
MGADLFIFKNPTASLLGGVAFLVLTLITAWAGVKSDILRDSQPTSFGGATSPAGEALRRPYSLAQTQMAFWYVLVVASFVYLVLVLQTFDKILTDQSLLLLGIGTGTALGASIVEQTKSDTLKSGELTTLKKFQNVLAEIKSAPTPALLAQRDELARQLASENFLKDILSDVDGVSLHRFQSFVWTLLLGILFLYTVLSQLAFPTFDARTLALLGISGGTYLGFKIPEQPA